MSSSSPAVTPARRWQGQLDAMARPWSHHARVEERCGSYACRLTARSPERQSNGSKPCHDPHEERASPRRKGVQVVIAIRKMDDGDIADGLLVSPSAFECR